MFLKNPFETGFRAAALFTQCIMPLVTYALGLIVFLAHSWHCKRRTWFSEVMIFIVWHRQKAIPCLFGIRSPAGSPLWLILYSPKALCLPACALSWILNSIWTQQCQSRFPSTCPLSWIAPASSVQSITLPFSDWLGVGCWATSTKTKEVTLSTSDLLLRHDAVIIPSDFLSWGWWKFQGFAHIISHLAELAISALHHW